MASLIGVNNLLILQGRMEAKQIGVMLNTPQTLVEAMLERLEAMGRVVRVGSAPKTGGSCKGCPSGKTCQIELWSANPPPVSPGVADADHVPEWGAD
ncbi:ferrous iron transporter C [Salmonella enterica]|nr:ferrous iron transporter C [Salmonella enterica]